MRYVLLHRDAEAYWIAEVPSLPGCWTYGATREEVIEKIKWAILEYLEGLERDGQPIPDDYYRPELVEVEFAGE